MAFKILLWVSAIACWLVVAMFIGAYLWDLWKDVKAVLSFARAWDRVLRKKGERVWWNPLNRVYLRGLFWDLWLCVDFTIVFEDGTRWSSEEHRR